MRTRVVDLTKEPPTIWVRGQADGGLVEIPRADLRLLLNDRLLVCEPHALGAEEDVLKAEGHMRSEPRAGGECVYCAEARPMQQHPRDLWGNDICGADFMAGTICTMPPDHAETMGRGCEAYCQRCEGDWYDETCECG